MVGACQGVTGAGNGSQPGSGDPTTTPALVASITDGDTLVVATDGVELDVRLSGINAPEAGECFFQEAADHLEGILDGGRVSIEATGSDQYGRVLAYIWLEDLMVNLAMVENGHAIASTPAPDDSHGELLLDAETRAADAGAGLWAGDVCGSDGEIPHLRVDLSASQTDPTGRDEDMLDEEWVTLVSDANVDLGGWTVRDESSLHRCRLTPGDELGPGRQLTITSADSCWEPGGSPVWNNGGDLVMVLDTRGRVVTHSRYR